MREPRYIRLADMLATAIQTGEIAPGTKLPTHRAFAEQFNVALATATRVYGELERKGMIVGEAGRGTFVRDPGLPPSLGLRQTDNDGSTDLVFNMPGDAADAEMLRTGLRRLAVAGDLESMLRYQPHGGRAHERRIIAGFLSSVLGPIDSDCLLITSGGQHGLAITVLGLLAHGDLIATDALTYPGFKSVAALQAIQLLPVDGLDGVMNPDDLERQCRERKIRALYLMPTVHNPLGTVMDEMTRRAIVEIARTYDLLVIEDAAYAFLEPDPPPSLFALAPERTVHVGGFSKSLATGLRLGYVIAPAHHCDRLLETIRATTWNAPALISGLVAGWVGDGTLASAETKRRRDGEERQQLCRDVLGASSLLSHRNAGFAWLPLEKGLRSEPIVASLKKKGIAASGAEPFATTGAVPQALRLAFGGLQKDELKGIFEIVREAVYGDFGA